jgi:UDP-3-O-[3-hydroxymyristoyl] glucosamine N-acyltransferase
MEGKEMTIKGYTLQTIAETVGGELYGDPEVIIERVLPIEDAEPGDISLASDLKAIAMIKESKASALIVSLDSAEMDRNLIRVRNPRQALIPLLNLFYPRTARQAFIHSQAVVSPSARLDPSVSIDASAYISAEVVLGANVVIYPNVYVGEGSEIGEQSEIYPNVTIYPKTRIGKRVRIHAGTVIGSDGFGYMKHESGVQEKIPQIGSVEIEDDVEIGANCTIDRATLGTTRICAGTKIDNLVQVGHNSEIGQHSVIVAQVGISGSVLMGKRCVLAGQVGVSDHVRLEDDAVVGAQSGVVRDLKAGRWLGTPAVPSIKAIRVSHFIPKIPELYRQIQTLEKRLTELKEYTKLAEETKDSDQ